MSTTSGLCYHDYTGFVGAQVCQLPVVYVTMTTLVSLEPRYVNYQWFMLPCFQSVTLDPNQRDNIVTVVLNYMSWSTTTILSHCLKQYMLIV